MYELISLGKILKVLGLNDNGQVPLAKDVDKIYGIMALEIMSILYNAMRNGRISSDMLQEKLSNVGVPENHIGDILDYWNGINGGQYRK